MLPILSTDQVRKADIFTIENEPVSSIDLMERACEAFTKWFCHLFDSSHRINIICGPGNNGGDGLGIGRLLLDTGYEVDVFTIPSENFSNDYEKNLKRFEDQKATIAYTEETKAVLSGDVIIDAIFGSGLSRAPGGIFKELIEKVNESDAIIISVDIPSGLRADESSHGSIIHADFTVSFQYPKLGLLLPENAIYSGDTEVVDIGILPEALEAYSLSQYVIEKSDIQAIWPIRRKFDHKNKFGHLLIAGGSKGKIGAIVMASKAALRTGTGLLTSNIPSCGYNILQTAVPEAMVLVDKESDTLSAIDSIDSFDVVACGPGMDTTYNSIEYLRNLLQLSPRHLVLDADAINILAANRELLSLLPENSIITPHPGEFKRLVGTWDNDFNKLEILKEFCQKYKIIVVLKGANSVVCLPDGDLYFNATGNPGMATAGSGDVLTGIIGSLLGQWGEPAYAAITGVYLHGMAGDIASIELGEDSLIATDIIDYLPSAILDLHQ